MVSQMFVIVSKLIAIKMKFDSICLYFLTWSPARGSIKIGLIYICQLLTSISDVISECQHCAGTCDWRLLLQPL